MTNCPTCNQSLATPALAFLHERFHGANMHALSESQSQTIASLMEAYAAQALAERNREEATSGPQRATPASPEQVQAQSKQAKEMVYDEAVAAYEEFLKALTAPLGIQPDRKLPPWLLKTAFISSDGERFATAEEAVRHNNELRATPPPSPVAAELPTEPGLWFRDGNPYLVARPLFDRNLLVWVRLSADMRISSGSVSREGAMVGGWTKATPHLTPSERDGYLQDFVESQKALKDAQSQIATLQAQLAAAREECEAMREAIWEVRRTTYLDDDVINRFHTLDCNSEALKKLFAFTMPKEERDG